MILNRTLKFIWLAAHLALFSCSGDSAKREQQGITPSIPEGLNSNTELRFRQYWTQGRLLYKKHCVGCHQNDGSGLAQLIPPLAGSDYLQRKEEVICIIKWGQQGHVIVNGVSYNGNMPPNPQLAPLEVAEIATYIFNAWGNKGSYVNVTEAEAVLKNCESRSHQPE